MLPALPARGVQSGAGCSARCPVTTNRWPQLHHQRPHRSQVSLTSVPDDAVSPAGPTVVSRPEAEATPSQGQPKRVKRQAESTDAVATFLSRRFGIAGGLGWLAVLAVGSLGEQVKTRMEVAAEEKAVQDVKEVKEVTLPSGVRYSDLKLGGGSVPIKGYLAVVHYRGKANGEQFEDTYARGKPIVYLWGGRPFSGGLCAGVEQGMADMKAGGRRIIKVPASLGFGAAGAALRPTLHVGDKAGVIPPDAELEYDVELLRVSIPPS